jgi:DNA-binding MurR/RpiR family transcriptional regulator
MTRKEQQVAAVVTDLHDETLTLVQVAAKHGVSYATILRLAKRNNLSSLRAVGRPWGAKKAIKQNQ